MSSRMNNLLNILLKKPQNQRRVKEGHTYQAQVRRTHTEHSLEEQNGSDNFTLNKRRL